MKTLANIFWLGIKELRGLLGSIALVIFIAYSFTFSVYQQAKGVPETVNKASVAFVDEDGSSLSGRMRNALYPPYFKVPELICASEIDAAMDQSRFMFVVVVPPRFESDVKEGRQPEVQVNIDATAVNQAGIGASYIQSILTDEINRFALRSDSKTTQYVKLVKRKAFNPNGTQSWFMAVVSVLDQLSMLTIILTGAALLREREHGTIEHLLVMPLSSFEIAVSKVWANCLVILVCFMVSMLVIVEKAIGVPFAGSHMLLLAGTMIYLFAAAAIGIFLATIAKSMAQFGLLCMMTIMPMMMLSGGVTPVESQPAWLQPITWLLPSRHYISFAQAIVYRGAGFDIVWPEFAATAGLGLVFFLVSLALFRRSIAVNK